MDSGTVQRASGQRGIGDCRLRAAVAIEVDAIFVAVRGLQGRGLGSLAAHSPRTSGIPRHLVIALLGLDAFGSGDPRKQGIQRPFTENARTIQEIDGPGVKGPVKLFEIKIPAFVEGRDGIC